MRLHKRQCAPRRMESRAGAALVELAVCFPVLMLMLLGIIELGRALSVSQILNSAAREGCRTAILDGSTNASVTSDIKLMVSSSAGCDEDDVDVSIVVTSYSSGQPVSDVSQAETRDLVEIDVTVPYSAISFAVNRWMVGHSLRGACDMRHE